MADKEFHPETEPAEPSSAGPDRLDSWKEISAYLKRDIRTLRRWEKDQGLPVHRHVHKKLASVYAYRAELDAWWRNGHERLEATEAARTREDAGRRRKWALAGAVAVLAAASVGVWMWRAQVPALPFEARDWVLIAQFENRTGEPVFDGTLEFALERELSNSQYVNVVPRERVNDTLLLMRTPLETRIDPAVGREVALRDGGIRALITGRMEKLDSTYLLSAALVNPADGVTVASFSEEAAGQKAVLPAMRRLSSGVRRSLGEKRAQIRESEQKLVKVTTPSLRALQLYSQADAMMHEYPMRRSHMAEPLLRQAVEEDPEFASGYIHLAWTIRNQGRPEAEYRPPADRARALADKVSDRERNFIQGSYYHIVGQEEKAIPYYETLLRLYPDHYWGLNNLRNTLWRLDRAEEATPYVIRRADLRPNEFQANCTAALHLARYVGEKGIPKAQVYVERARQLWTSETTSRFPDCASAMELWPAFEHLVEGKVAEALQVVDRVAATVPARAGQEQAAYARNVAWVYYALGKLSRAEEFFQLGEPRKARFHNVLAWVAWSRGDQRVLREHLRESWRSPERLDWYDQGILFARAGLLAEAEEWVKLYGTVPGAGLVRGELALARGQTTEAVAQLREELVSARRKSLGQHGFAAECLAHALEQQGDWGGALRALAEFPQDKLRLQGETMVGEWLDVQQRRARLYRQLGREKKAEEIESELRRYLAVADADHAILRELKRSPAVAQATSSR